MHRVITYHEIEKAIQEAYDLYKDNNDGKNANYIPYLDQIPSDLFGISVCLANGHTIEVGDSSYKFGVESISKVFTALLAMSQLGSDKILELIGADATGLPFNSIMAILLENDHPSTPLVNAGAISACSLIEPKGNNDAKWNAIVGFMEDMTGAKIELLEELYKSESETNYNNRAISWLLKNYGRIYDDPDSSLDIYTRQCSLAVSARDLSVAAATIANSGINPTNEKKVFKPEISPNIVSLMASVGFYEHTGDWMFSTGIPAKTGVGGGVMGVIPGVLGIAAFAPPLDESGNSVKAQLAIKHIANSLNLGIFDANRSIIASTDEHFK